MFAPHIHNSSQAHNCSENMADKQQRKLQHEISVWFSKMITDNDNTDLNRVTDLHFWLAVVREVLFVEFPCHHDVGTALGYSTRSPYSKYFSKIIKVWFNIENKCFCMVRSVIVSREFSALHVLRCVVFCCIGTQTAPV